MSEVIRKDLKQRMKSFDPLNVQFHITFEMLKEMVECAIEEKTGKRIKADFKAIEDTGRVAIDFDCMDSDDEETFREAGCDSCLDDELADFVDEIVEEYFGAPVSVVCNGCDEGTWCLSDFDVLMDFQTYMYRLVEE